MVAAGPLGFLIHIEAFAVARSLVWGSCVGVCAVTRLEGASHEACGHPWIGKGVAVAGHVRDVHDARETAAATATAQQTPETVPEQR